LLSYVVQHPERSEFRVSALVLERGKRAASKREIRIFADPIEGNHDPCVLTDPWFYSYCHASELVRSHMGSGSLIFFYDHVRNAFDTVFSVKVKHEWARHKPRSLPLPIRVHLSSSGEKDAWELHFKWPGKGAHENAKWTFQAAMFPDGRYSFLPIHSSDSPTAADLGLSWLIRRIRAYGHGKRPFQLTPGEALDLYAATSRTADVKVVGQVRLLDAKDIAQIGAEPGRKKGRHCGR